MYDFKGKVNMCWKYIHSSLNSFIYSCMPSKEVEMIYRNVYSININ